MNTHAETRNTLSKTDLPPCVVVVVFFMFICFIVVGCCYVYQIFDICDEVIQNQRILFWSEINQFYKSGNLVVYR